MGPLVPHNPSELMVIRNVTSDVITMSLPFARFGHLRFGSRGTLVKMSSGAVAVFSPVSLTPEVREAVTTLGGRVGYIAALDMEHHIHISTWKAAYPDAQVIAPEGLWEKRQATHVYRDDPASPFEHIFTPGRRSVTPEFDADFATEYVHAHRSRELVFLHRPSRTLIEGDLLFNLPAREQYSRASQSPTGGILTKMVIPFLSTEPSASWQRMFVWYLLSADTKAFAESMRRIDGWEFNRLIPCHGDVVGNGAKGVFRSVMDGFLSGNLSLK
ncbi:hypothetical protein P168DRAFT_325257 [Aspergillus campestris IBT 28561]|uniref:Nuclear protein Qri2/Nse4 n=1 Tax=Aspergillus campestris (strain IBT 28561) TaxID=1392248 RepID=A0A2I1D924_ASPC2|nr:uncharacterized protein P168DRAFT_325257 [Aspergillus campestris IBT 28561]PKY06384.1 hypothetical protein P168DRAFT_325257 [Aspergillus campestris IBT 28561]